MSHSTWGEAALTGLVYIVTELASDTTHLCLFIRAQYRAALALPPPECVILSMKQGNTETMSSSCYGLQYEVISDT